MSNPKIVLLAGKGNSTNILYHALKNEFAIAAVILENGISKKTLITKRIKKLGLWKVLGQILFRLLIVRVLNFFSAKRKKDIMAQCGLANVLLPEEKITLVNSVNDDRCLQILQSIQPDLVIVNGTRIISEQVLREVSCKFINLHAGITPKYRGVHGAYWALVNNDEAHCGVTIHLVDAGIDTGGVIARQKITVSQKDNFVTYPLLQLAAGIPYMKKAIEDILQNRLALLTANTTESRLWSHPTIWEYLFYRIVYKKK